MTKYTKSFAESLKEVRKPKVVNEFKKMNAMYGESNRPHRYLETKPGSLEEAVLKARGLVK